MAGDGMICPKCISPMATVEFGGVEIERCSNCQGLWSMCLKSRCYPRRAGNSSGCLKSPVTHLHLKMKEGRGHTQALYRLPPFPFWSLVFY